MDLNLVVLAGRLTTTPDVGMLDSGSRFIRLILAIRSEAPHSRLDVVPVVWWDPDEETVNNLPAPGQRMWITGSFQRRFWEGPDGPRSRMEIVAHHVTIYPEEVIESSFARAPNGP